MTLSEYAGTHASDCDCNGCVWIESYILGSLCADVPVFNLTFDMVDANARVMAVEAMRVHDPAEFGVLSGMHMTGEF